MKSNARVWQPTLGAVLALALGGCGRPAAPKSGTQAAATSVEPAAVASKPAAPAKKEVAERYPLTGEITGIDAARKVLIVYHDEIKDYMPAMTMEFKSPQGGLPPGVKAGDAIRFDFVITRDGEFQTTKVERAGAGAKAADPHAGHGAPK